MNQYDILFRALTEYRKNTKENADCVARRSAIMASNPEQDRIVVKRYSCKIDEDWIEAIERGIEFIEKAINEQRQFIRSNGEIVPIEKVKRVSKDSVAHLARHSNLITKEQDENEDLLPEHLYMVERLSDFAVYENRFLYMLLCYLRDFISLRYEKITEITNTYNGELSMHKTVQESQRKVAFDITLKEEKKNDEYLRAHNSSQSVIDRIQGIYKAVLFFLKTPLMVEVSKSPVVKPPITRTNVLRMNRNFRETLSLYEYISAYDKDGYELKTDVKTISPFTGAIADEFAETAEIAAFLTYEHGLNIKEYFKRAYESEEERRREEEANKHAEQIKSVRRRLKDGEISPEEFIVMLEKRISDLERRADDYSAVKNKLEELYTENEKYKFALNDAKDKINALESQVFTLNRKYEDDMLALSTRYAEETETLNKLHDEKIAALCSENEERISELNARHTAEIDGINERRSAEIAEIYARHSEEINDLNSELNETKENCRAEVERVQSELKTRLNEFSTSLAVAKTDLYVLQDKYATLADEKTLADGRLLAIRSEYGLVKESEDFTSEEMVDELEHQYEVFKKFFKTEWKKAKKAIRQNMFASLKAELGKKSDKAAEMQSASPEETDAKAVNAGNPVNTDSADADIVNMESENSNSEKSED